MTTEAISRREFLERLGILGGLGALYSGMTGFGLLATAQATAGRPELEQRAGEGQHIVILCAGVAGLCAAYLLRKACRLLGRICQTRPGAGHTIENNQLILNIRQSINHKGDWFWPATI